MNKYFRISAIVILLVVGCLLARHYVVRTCSDRRVPGNIHEAAVAGDVASIQRFLDRGVDVDQVGRDGGLTPLQVALYADQDAAARLLISRGAKVDLCIASAIGDMELVEELIADEADVNAHSAGGTPLTWASRKGHLDVVQLLVRRGAEVNAHSKGKLTTAMHEAAANGHAAVVEYLLSNGADPDIRNNRGRTPLHEASISNRLDAARVLLSSGARVDLEDDAGYTPLLWACHPIRDTRDLVELLVSAGADPTARADNGSTPVSRARALGLTDLVRIMEGGPAR